MLRSPLVRSTLFSKGATSRTALSHSTTATRRSATRIPRPSTITSSSPPSPRKFHSKPSTLSFPFGISVVASVVYIAGVQPDALLPEIGDYNSFIIESANKLRLGHNDRPDTSNDNSVTVDNSHTHSDAVEAENTDEEMIPEVLLPRSQAAPLPKKGWTSSLTSTISSSKDFISQISSQAADLSKLEIPPSYLSTKSSVEFAATGASNHDLFLAQADPDATPERRAFNVVVNYLASLKTQVFSDEDGGFKKPLTPFVGEVFTGSYESDKGATRVWCEQVSEQVTAYALCNPIYGIRSEGSVTEKTSFSATSGVKVQQLGYATITVDIPTSTSSLFSTNTNSSSQEIHLATLPILELKDLLKGRPYPQISPSTKCYILSNTGYMTQISFQPAKKASSSIPDVKATFYKLENMDISNRIPLYEIEGRWNGEFKVSPSEKSLPSSNPQTQQLLPSSINIANTPPTQLTQPPLNQQDPLESRRAWQHVARAIQNNDSKLMAVEKSKIEKTQQLLRKAEQQSGKEAARAFFRKANDEDREDVKRLQQMAAKLVADAGAKGGALDSMLSRPLAQTQKQEGLPVWRFVGVEEAAKRQGRGRLLESAAL